MNNLFKIFSEYDILVVQQIKKCIFPETGELYEILKTTHESICYSGHDRMIFEL